MQRFGLGQFAQYTREEGNAVQHYYMLHFILMILDRNEFGLPFQQIRPVQNYVEVEYLSVMRDHSSWTRGGAHTNKLAGPLPDRPKTSAVLAASLAVYVVFHVLAPRTKLLHTDEVRHVCFRLVRIPRILGGRKIVTRSLFEFAGKMSFRGLI